MICACPAHVFHPQIQSHIHTHTVNISLWLLATILENRDQGFCPLLLVHMLRQQHKKNVVTKYNPFIYSLNRTCFLSTFSYYWNARETRPSVHKLIV